MHAGKRVSCARVHGWSVSARDGVALSGVVAGVLTTVFAGRSVGGLVLQATGSVWLGTCAWVGTLLVGVTLVLAGFAWLVTERRTYRHDGEPRSYRAPGERRDGTRAIERPMRVSSK